MYLRLTVLKYGKNIVAALLFLIAHHAWSEANAVLTPEICTGMHYLAPDDFTSRSPLAMSPNGKLIAYVVQVPDISANINREELYLTALNGNVERQRGAVLVQTLIAAMRWFPDNRHLAALIREHDKVVLARIDTQTGYYNVIWKDATDISDYSMSTDGTTIAVGVKVPEVHEDIRNKQSDIDKGYRVGFQIESAAKWPRRKLIILKRIGAQEWKVTQHVTFRSPLSGKTISESLDNPSTHINMSPDGHYLLIDNDEDFSDTDLPETWRADRTVQFLMGRFPGVIINYLYDLETKTVSLSLQSPVVRYTEWAPDSRSYAVVGLAPVGSSWEEDDLTKAKPNDHATHLFSVEVKTHTVTEVLKRAERPPLMITPTGEMIVQDAIGAIRFFRKTIDQWSQTLTFEIPLSGGSRYRPVATDGLQFVGEYETPNIAPQLFQYVPPSNTVRVIARLDPQVDGLLLPKAEDISWTTSTGYHARGVLLLPPHYDPQQRYPLVIEDGSILYSGGFVCDAGPEHVSSFARGILADSGIIYLMRLWPGNNDWENNFFPTGYPGGVAEAAFRMDLVNSAIRYLDTRGIIDPTKVGLIGFSRGGWYAEFALAHSSAAFAVATATDNVQYSLGEYWDSHNDFLMHSEEAMYGGPPYGDSLRNWLQYSISFNLDKIHTPLMIEVMGNGLKDDDSRKTPFNLAVHSEIFEGLRSLHKPVELYYYPDEKHQPDHPQARIASLQRNVDWYRFWLQGYKRPNPDDPNQYQRWEHLRELQEVEEKATAQQHTTDVPKVN